jgi:monomeric sarcosine oxidase
MRAYDVIVLGAGGVGSAAAFHLARGGARVLTLERFGAGHDRGSSHGQTRVIRQAYFEHPDYVPLLRRAYELWRELEERRQETLYHPVGLLEIGPPEGVIVPGVLEAARIHGLEVESVTRERAEALYPAFRFPEDCGFVFEKNAGYLRVEACVHAHLEEAAREGATFRFEEPAIRWAATGDGVLVETESATYFADRLVVCGGPWAGTILADLGVRFDVLRKHLYWFATDDTRYSAATGCPTFFFELPEGHFYGFPDIEGAGVKVSEHSGGEIIADATNLDRSVDPVDRSRVERFVCAHLPGLVVRPKTHAACMYTRSPDGHFLVGRHPGKERVAFAAGLSGHGFKFAPVLGEILADLTIGGRARMPIEFLSPSRF